MINPKFNHAMPPNRGFPPWNGTSLIVEATSFQTKRRRREKSMIFFPESWHCQMGKKYPNCLQGQKLFRMFQMETCYRATMQSARLNPQLSVSRCLKKIEPFNHQLVLTIKERNVSKPLILLLLDSSWLALKSTITEYIYCSIYTQMQSRCI